MLSKYLIRSDKGVPKATLTVCSPFGIKILDMPEETTERNADNRFLNVSVFFIPLPFDWLIFIRAATMRL